MRLGYRAIFLGLFLTVVFSVIAIYLEMIVRNNFTVSDTLIPVLTYFFLLVLLLIINPLMKFVYKNIVETRLFRPFNRHEVLLITVMTLVTSGISGYGLMNYLVPFIGTINSPSRSTNQSDWGLLSQTVLILKSDGKTRVYGDVEQEDDSQITLKIYNGKGKGVDDSKSFAKSEVTIQRPLINPNLVLNRQDAVVFENGLPEIAIKDEVAQKTIYRAQNSFPAYLPFPKETYDAWKERVGKYLKDGKIQEGYTFWGNVPWQVIGKPFCYWLIFVVLLYLILFSLAKILFTQWAKYERLQFPLATIPQELLGESGDDPDSKTYPTLSIWRNIFFLIGFVLAISFILLAAFYPSLVSLGLVVKDYVPGTIFEGLSDANIVLHVFFLLIGIAFLVPKEISFSVWFFGLIFILQILFAIWFGFGKSAASFGTDYYTKINFYTAQSLGGLIVFSGFALWNVRHYLLAGVYKAFGIKPSSVNVEIINETSLASNIFIVSGIGIFSFMLWMNISFWWAAIYCFVTLMFIVASMRVASECGIIGFQNITGGGGHFVSNVIGIKTLGINSFVNVIVLQIVFFFDTKLFLAPNVMVAQKVEDENKIQKKVFWTVLFSAVVLAVFVSFAYMVMLLYHQGSKNMESWYYVSVPNDLYSRCVQMIKNGDAEPMINMNPYMTGFIIFGMASMAALLFARTKWFWVPHPVGILLWISPDETKYFLFSFFLGWLIKYIVVKLGTKETIENMKKWAIGLIFGHITGIIIIGICKMFVTLTAKATLNFH